MSIDLRAAIHGWLRGLLLLPVGTKHETGLQEGWTDKCHSVMPNSPGTPWTAAHQAPLSMRFPRQESWSGFPFPSPVLLSNIWQKVFFFSLCISSLTPGRLPHVLQFYESSRELLRHDIWFDIGLFSLSCLTHHCKGQGMNFVSFCLHCPWIILW